VPPEHPTTTSLVTKTGAFEIDHSEGRRLKVRLKPEPAPEPEAETKPKPRRRRRAPAAGKPAAAGKG
jgi:hypothetical protein